MDLRLDDYNWQEAFEFAKGTPVIGSLAKAGSFDIEDVEEIKGIDEGERDELNWIVWGILKDGRYFSLSAGCDYTGWDCQASGDGRVAETEDEIIRFGMDDEERKRFGIANPQ